MAAVGTEKDSRQPCVSLQKHWMKKGPWGADIYIYIYSFFLLLVSSPCFFKIVLQPLKRPVPIRNPKTAPESTCSPLALRPCLLHPVTGDHLQPGDHPFFKSNFFFQKMAQKLGGSKSFFFFSKICGLKTVCQRCFFWV